MAYGTDGLRPGRWHARTRSGYCAFASDDLDRCTYWAMEHDPNHGLVHPTTYVVVPSYEENP
jgi:hypothetical protein